MYILIILCISFSEWIGNSSWLDQFLVARAASEVALQVHFSRLFKSKAILRCVLKPLRFVFHNCVVLNNCFNITRQIFVYTYKSLLYSNAFILNCTLFNSDGQLSDFHKQLFSVSKIVIITIVVKIHVFHIRMYSY